MRVPLRRREPRARAEPSPARASTVRAFLLVENPGPWGTDALRDARLPDARQGGAPAPLRGRTACACCWCAGTAAPRRGPGIRVFAAYADAVAPWMETADRSRHPRCCSTSTSRRWDAAGRPG